MIFKKQSIDYYRYIELFKSDLSEANAVSRKMRGGGIRPLMGGPGMMPRPGPYDRQERFMGGMMGGPGGYGRGRGGRNVKGGWCPETVSHCIH